MVRRHGRLSLYSRANYTILVTDEHSTTLTLLGARYNDVTNEKCVSFRSARVVQIPMFHTGRVYLMVPDTCFRRLMMRKGKESKSLYYDMFRHTSGSVEPKNVYALPIPAQRQHMRCQSS